MTVRAVTSPELTKLRGKNQYSEVFAICRVPNVIYSARLASLPTTTDMVSSISVDNGSGTAANIKSDMKILVGTSAGADDLGFCRMRKVPTIVAGAGTFDISELSHIDWQASCYLTVIDDYDIMPRHLKIVSGTPYIDYDITYNKHHEDFQPVVNMGGHRVLVLSSGTVSHSRTAVDSFVFDGTILSYSWEAPNSSSITGGTTSTATITYTSAGHFCEYLTLTTNDGKTWTSVRYVFVLASEPTSSNISNLRVDESPIDGASATFDMVQNAKLTNFSHRAFVILWFKTYYDSAKEYISNAHTNEQNILMSGRISDEKLVFNDEIGIVQFTIQSWKYWMTKISSFPFGLERAITSTPTSWTEMTGLNVDRAIWALLHEYCTITRIADFYKSGDTRYAAELMCVNNNLASQIEEISLATIYADLTVNRLGELRLRIEPQLVSIANRSSWVTVQTITSEDYEEGLNFELNTYEETSQISLSGVSVPQYGSSSPHFSLSYGRVYAPFGDAATEDNLLLENQTQSNSLAGIVMGWRNRKFDNIEIKFIGQNFMFSICEYCRAAITISTSGNPRGINYSGNLIPRTISYEWDEDSGIFSTSVSFEDESEEKISVTGDFPVETSIDVDFSIEPFPEISLPPLVPIPMPVDIINTTMPKKVVIATNKGMFYTETFDQSTPTWIAMNGGLDAGQITTIGQFVVTPSKTMYILTEWTAGRGYLRMMGCGGIGGSWKQVLHADSYPVDYANAGIWGMGADSYSSDLVGVHGGRGWSWPYDGNIGESRMGFVSLGSSSWAGKLQDYSRLYSSMLARTGNKWFIACSQGSGILGSFASAACIIATKSGSLFNAFLINGSDASNYSAIPIGSGGTAMTWDVGGNAGYNFIETSATKYTLIDPNSKYGVVFAPNGLNGMGSSGLSATPYSTSDGGASWQSLAGVIPNGFTAWENCGDNNRFIFAGGTEIRITLDNGATYYNKAGNLSLVAPLVSITAARFIE